MKTRLTKRIALILLCVAPAALVADEANLPEPAARKIDFHKDVLAILANSCAKCHAGGQQKGGFSFDTRESLLKGGESGAVVAVGKSGESRLIALVAGLEPEVIMPAQGPRLTAEQIGVLRAWIDQGLGWEEGFSFRKVGRTPLAPRKVAVPLAKAESKSKNPIDLILEPYFAASKVTLGETVDDRTFLRRAYLDVLGLPPTANDAERFMSDANPDKRGQLVRTLLDDKRQYAIHWLTFWNDALRNDYRGTGYIDGGRLQITDWLAKALADNLPYDEFVRQLISPSEQSAGFIKGIVWRGVVNASQVPPIQAAQNISQVFLGINLKCASCHDSFINDWKLTDAYGLASIFADGPLEIHRCDQPTGKFAAMQFLYPELGSVDANAPRDERLKQLARAITQPANGRLARTFVNRLWARLLGRGLIEPVDEMDNPSWSADLLDFLANDFVEHGYDVKYAIAQIVTSRAYQLAAVGGGDDTREEFVFRGPLVRRMTAEQFVDAVSALAEVEYSPAVVKPAALAASGPDVAGKTHVRAALINADPLLTALGRSNREQVVTERPKTATTLQALELTNGSPLSTFLVKGAKKWSEKNLEPRQLIERVYRAALLRAPNNDETSLAMELLGKTATPESIEDLLWAVVMLPEFQLIY